MPKHTRIKREWGPIVVTWSCLMLASDEVVNRSLHNLRKVKGHTNIEGRRSLGFGVEPERC
jgi:hypothetical protein